MYRFTGIPFYQRQIHRMIPTLTNRFFSYYNVTRVKSCSFQGGFAITGYKGHLCSDMACIPSLTLSLQIAQLLVRTCDSKKTCHELHFDQFVFTTYCAAP